MWVHVGVCSFKLEAIGQSRRAWLHATFARRSAAGRRRRDVGSRSRRALCGWQQACRAVLVRMQEDSQKEPRWQARWTADSRDTATTTFRRRHLPKWDCRRNGSAALATHFRLPFQWLSLTPGCTHSRSTTRYVSSGAAGGREIHYCCIFGTEEYVRISSYLLRRGFEMAKF